MPNKVFTQPPHNLDHTTALLRVNPNGEMMMVRPKLNPGTLLGVGLVVMSGLVWFNMMVRQAPNARQAERIGSVTVRQAASVNTVTVPTIAIPPATGTQIETVRAIQRELQQRGYGSGDGDGIVGPITRATILAYEFDRGMALTGIVSDELLRAIVLGSATTEPVSPTTAKTTLAPAAKQAVRDVQLQLTTLGYGSASKDGQLDDTTVKAIKRFERDQGLAETGRISGPLVAKLIRLTTQPPKR
jgi:peptidoglycan hydrolase-like protein with peptidoglycan-binding domain